MKIKHRHFNKAKLCSALVVLGTSALFTISCSDNILGTDEQVNIDGKAVRFHIVDGQQVAWIFNSKSSSSETYGK